MMHIAFCTDTNYIMPTGVAMISICENNKEEEITFHLVITDEGASPYEVDEKVKPMVEIAEKYGKEYKIYRLSSETLKEFVCSGADYISTTAFARIFLPNLLSKSIAKVLYLDCDIIVDGSLRELWNTNLDYDCPFAAAIDATCLTQYNHFENKGKKMSIYCNSGVLLINLDCWRHENLVENTIGCANEFKFPLLDQDVLNYLYYDKFLEINPTYNYQILYDFSGCSFIPKSHSTLVESIKDHPIIIHYICPNKPWKKEYCPRRVVWERYLNMSVWKGIEYASVITRFDRTAIYNDLINTYWSDPLLFQKEIQPFLRLFKTSVRLKHKSQILECCMRPISIAASFIESIYKYKTRK